MPYPVGQFKKNFRYRRASQDGDPFFFANRFHFLVPAKPRWHESVDVSLSGEEVAIPFSVGRLWDGCMSAWGGSAAGTGQRTTTTHLDGGSVA